MTTPRATAPSGPICTAPFRLVGRGEAGHLHPLGRVLRPGLGRAERRPGRGGRAGRFRHNAYAEWYGNTIRIPGSPAAEHHREVYGDAPYDDFLDAWTAERFDPTAWAELFAAAGASYVIPTTKHHDGIALWDAPGTGTRNTVHRGPRRDLVQEIADAVRAVGLRFGVYYSGGLDWSVSNFPPHTDVRRGTRPAAGRRRPTTRTRCCTSGT